MECILLILSPHSVTSLPTDKAETLLLSMALQGRGVLRHLCRLQGEDQSNGARTVLQLWWDAVSILEAGIPILRRKREARPLGDTAGLAWKRQVHIKPCA